MDKTSLGDRMKGYEAVPKIHLMRRTPVIMRIDGKAFHTFTRGFDKPFDEDFMTAMQQTMKLLCENVQGCVLGYTQSDEISLVLCDYQKLDTDCWFGYSVQKMVSVAASMATYAFNRMIDNIAAEMFEKAGNKFTAKCELLNNKRNIGAFFDARCFNVPLAEVNNCLLWRQQDATRNSIQALAQSLYSQKEMHGINTKDLQDKMFTEKGVNWNDLPVYKKRGSCCVKKDEGWEIDLNIPIFSQDTEYINSRIIFEGE